MELTDLKNTWNKIASNKELDENQLNMMLSKRTKNLTERIERNIKIGFIVLFAFFLIVILNEYIISSIMLESLYESYSVPNWFLFLSMFSYTLIFTTFIYFVIKYYRVKRSCDVDCNLKNTLAKTINTLKLYQRLFYLALGMLTLTMALGFIAGLYQESLSELEKHGVTFSEIQIDQLLLQIAIGLVFLLVVVGGIFIFLRWGFRRLYGNYYHKLKQTLKELNEIKD